MEREEHVHVTVKVQGVVLPGWAVVVFALCLVFSAAGSLLLYLQNRELARRVERLPVIEEQLRDQQRAMTELKAKQEMMRLDFHDIELALTNEGSIEPEEANRP